jgi:outer membrane protein assembly factor BamB
LILVDGVLYTATSNGCGAVPNGVYALDINADAPRTVAWKTGGPSVAGTSGVAVGADGTIYAATAESSLGGNAMTTTGKETSHASTVVALEPKTLKLKDWFTAPGADFNASPVVIRHNSRDLVVITANDGRMYLLDGTSLGGSDHRTALHVTAKYTAPGVTAGVSSWEDQGTRWILAPAGSAAQAGIKVAANGPTPNGSVIAFKLVDQGGKAALEPTWSSRDMTSPLTPVIFAGVVFAVSSGEHRAAADARQTLTQRAKGSIPAVLYALDPATGKELWNSGKSITSFARGGLAAAAGQVYVVTYDHTLYAFGVPMEH